MSGAARSSKPNSLAIVTPFYPPAVGGVERYSQAFARAAVDMGLSVNIITTAENGTPKATVEDDGINVLRIPARYLAMQGSYFPIPMSGMREVAKFLRCDLILAQTRFFLTTILAATVAACQGKSICVVEHGSGPLRSNPMFALASMSYEHCITAALRLFSPRFFAVSSASAQWLRHFNIRCDSIVPNGITPRKEMPIRAAEMFKKPTIFFAGRLIREKGIEELVEGVELFARQGNEVELRVAGEGPLEGMLVERASKSAVLIYLGRLSPSEVAAELDRASLFVNPSNYSEGLPTVLLEAGAAALPVISTPQGSTDLIRDGVTGWIIPRGEPKYIASCLRSVTSQPEEAMRRGAELFRLIQEQYTWPSIVKTFLGHIA